MSKPKVNNGWKKSLRDWTKVLKEANKYQHLLVPDIYTMTRPYGIRGAPP